MEKIFIIFMLFLQFSSVVSMEEEKEKKWVFLRTSGWPSHEATDWRIKNNRLEFDINADDPIEFESFENLLKEAQTKNVPFILVGFVDIKEGTKKIYKFFDGGNASDSTLHWSWEKLEKQWINPHTMLAPTAAEFFVAGKDRDFVFLEARNNKESIKDAFTNGLSSKDLSNLRKNLKKPGYGHFVIAENLKYKAENEHDKDQKLATLQNAYKWYGWALEYLPKTDNSKHTEIKNKQNEISLAIEKILLPEIPEIPEGPSDLLLIQNLKNLTENLRKLSAKLSSFIF